LKLQAVSSYGSNAFDLYDPVQPHHAKAVPVHAAVLDVALQVAFERQTLKLVFHLIGYRLWV
jgi:hypothetical protein